MLKKDLVNSMADKTGLSKKNCESALDAFIEVVRETVSKGDKIKLVGFGTFDSKLRDERKAKNPKTGEDIDVPAMTSPTFKFARTFKEAIK